MPKAKRIAEGLRGDVGDPALAYAGTFVAEADERILSVAFRKGYPIALDEFDAMELSDGEAAGAVGTSCWAP